MDAKVYAITEVRNHSKKNGLSVDLVVLNAAGNAVKEIEGFNVNRQVKQKPSAQLHKGDGVWEAVYAYIEAIAEKESIELDAWNEMDKDDIETIFKALNKKIAKGDIKEAIEGRYIRVSTGVFHKWRTTKNDDWSERTDIRAEFLTVDELAEDYVALLAARISRQIANNAKLKEKDRLVVIALDSKGSSADVEDELEDE